MRNLLVMLVLMSVGPLVAQDLADVGGVWVGNSTFMKANYLVTFRIEQSGSQLKGVSTTASIDHKDSAVVAFTGVVEGAQVEIFATEFVYKKGNACLSNSAMIFSESERQYALKGKWKGDMRLTSCPPLVGGDIQLYRVKPELPQVSETVSTDPSVRIAESDDLGRALVAELSKRKYKALMIGVEAYPDPSIVELQHPLNDARALSKVLIEHYAFLPGDMVVLENPNRSEVIRAFDKLRSEVDEKDNLLVFYAGHGIWDEDLNQGYWLPNDASMGSKANWISNSTIRDYIRGIRTRHTLLISDACFSGGILKERAAFENSKAILELYKLPSRKAITSGTLKTVPDKSVFIEYLLKSLQTNEVPLLSADELYRTFKTAVINNSPNGQVPQYGPILQAGDEGGDFIFLKRTEQ